MNKVLFILGGGVYPYRIGGMEVFNYYLIKSLVEKLDVLTIADYDFDFPNVTRTSSWYLKPTKFFAPLQLLWYHLKHPDVKTVVLCFAQAHWLVWLIYGIIVRITGLSSIVVIHHGGPVPHEAKSVYKFFFKSMKHVVAVSDEIKKNYEVAYDVVCETIYPLVPFRISSDSCYDLREKYEIPHDAFVISMVGSIKPLKNPNTLFEALTLMTPDRIAKINPFALYAGDGPLRKDLESQVKSSILKNRVKFLGNIPKEDICEILKLSDIYLIASDSEGTSVSLLEAMYNRKKIIVTNAPGLKDMMQNQKDCMMFEVRDSQKLCSLIEEIFINEKEALLRSDSAYEKYVSNYDYNKMLNRYVEMICSE